MSVIIEFAMFPTDKGESVSQYVSQVIKSIQQSGVQYELTPMGTIIETPTLDEALAIINNSYKILEPFCNRVYSTVKLDIRKGEMGRMHKKIQSVVDKMQ